MAKTKEQSAVASEVKGALAGEVTKRTRSVQVGGADMLRWKVKRSIKTLKEMRDDPQIGLGLELVKAPIYGVDWAVECERDDIKEFVQGEITRIWRSAVRSCLTAVDFGFAAHEKVWELRDGKVRIKQLKDLDPEFCVLLHDEDGDFGGLRWKGETTVPAEKAFVFTHGKEFGNPYGRPRVKRSEKPWLWCKNVYDIMHRYLERKGDPPIKGRAPAERRHDANGTEVDTMDEMTKNLAALKSGGAVSFPSEYDEDGNPRWDAEYMLDDRRGPMFLEIIKHHQTMKLRGLFVPDQVATQDAKYGAYNIADAHIEMFLEGENQIVFDMLDHFNRYLIPQLVRFNYGPDAPETRITSKGLSEDTKSRMRWVVERILQEQSTAQLAAGIIDVAAVLEGAGVPLLEEKERNRIVEEFRLRLAKNPEAALALRGNDTRTQMADHGRDEAVALFDALIADVKKNSSRGTSARLTGSSAGTN